MTHPGEGFRPLPHHHSAAAGFSPAFTGRRGRCGCARIRAALPGARPWWFVSCPPARPLLCAAGVSSSCRAVGKRAGPKGGGKKISPLPGVSSVKNLTLNLNLRHRLWAGVFFLGRHPPVDNPRLSWRPGCSRGAPPGRSVSFRLLCARWRSRAHRRPDIFFLCSTTLCVSCRGRGTPGRNTTARCPFSRRKKAWPGRGPPHHGCDRPCCW